MKSLNQIISENQEKFNNQEPKNEHFAKFLNKLNNQNNITQGRILPLWAKISAAASILLVFTLCAFYFFNQDFKNSDNYSDNASTEFTDVEMYYQKKISQQMVEFNNLNCNVENSEKQAIIRDLIKLDHNSLELQKELSKNANNVLIINALIKNYKIKSDLLEKIVNQIKSNC